MPITRAAIDELKAIHMQHFNEELSDDDAWTMGTDLVRLVSILSRPEVVPSTDVDDRAKQMVG